LHFFPANSGLAENDLPHEQATRMPFFTGPGVGIARGDLQAGHFTVLPARFDLA
jgi:hypothetical protein